MKILPIALAFALAAAGFGAFAFGPGWSKSLSDYDPSQYPRLAAADQRTFLAEFAPLVGDWMSAGSGNAVAATVGRRRHTLGLTTTIEAGPSARREAKDRRADWRATHCELRDELRVTGSGIELEFKIVTTSGRPMATMRSSDRTCAAARKRTARRAKANERAEQRAEKRRLAKARRARAESRMASEDRRSDRRADEEAVAATPPAAQPQTQTASGPPPAGARPGPVLRQRSAVPRKVAEANKAARPSRGELARERRLQREKTRSANRV